MKQKDSWMMKAKVTVETKTVTINTRHVQCPHCKTELTGVASEIIAMHCWHCKKPFRIEEE